MAGVSLPIMPHSIYECCYLPSEHNAYPFRNSNTHAREPLPKKPGPLRRFGLKPLSDWLGIRFQHHDALEDALACAKLLLAAGMDQDCDDLPDLEKKLRLQRGRAGSWGMKGPSTQRKRSEKKRSEQRTTNHLPFIKPSDLPGFSTSKKNNSRGDNADPAKPDSTADLQRLMIRLEFIRPLAQKNYLSLDPSENSQPKRLGSLYLDQVQSLQRT